MTVLITGGLGFIGSAVVRRLLATTDEVVVNMDCSTYAASPESLGEWLSHPRHIHIHADIGDTAAVAETFRRFAPARVMHLAAESHVDRSIDGPAQFIQTNIVGTQVLLEAARAHWMGLSGEAKANFRFHHVSTDEVFGSLGPNDPPFDEHTPYDPRSPYSASKAASDHLVRAWEHTYGLPAFVSNTTNNYGPWQFPEKLIPLVTLNALHGQPLPVYGNGMQVRDWIHVDDHAEALCLAFFHGTPGATYCLGPRQERANIDVVKAICRILDEKRPNAAGPRARLITYVKDRPGHDLRYAMDPSGAEKTLGWRAKYGFEDGLAATIQWYLDNEAWWGPIRSRKYAGQRLGAAE